MSAHDTKPRTARLFRNGRSQAVRIPKEFEFDVDEVTVHRNERGEIVLSPKSGERVSPILTWLKENGPIADFPRDPGEDDLLPLDDVKI